MMRSYWYLAPILIGIVLTTLGSYAAPLAVVGLAFGIFFGTVSMRGRRANPPRTEIPGTAIPGTAIANAPIPSAALGSEARSSHPGL
jgi:hypothetical protein